MGGLGGSGGEGKNFFPHPNELLIWAYPANFIDIGMLLEATYELCGSKKGMSTDT